jgi:hypothetical protein
VKTLLGGAAVALALVVAAPAGAQQRAPVREGETRREEAFKLVDAYVVSNVQESLGLTDEQFVKALPLVRRLQADRRDYLLGRTRRLREMRRLLRAGAASEAQVLEQLRELKTVEAEGPAQVRKSAEALDAVLSPLQQAKFRLLELEVEQRMRELVNRARDGGPGRRASPE